MLANALGAGLGYVSLHDVQAALDWPGKCKASSKREAVSKGWQYPLVWLNSPGWNLV